MTVILAYLLYTLYEADYLVRQSGDFYTDMGLSPGAEEKAIKSRFRRLYAIAEVYEDWAHLLTILTEPLFIILTSSLPRIP
jgi:propanediol dehydratase large subunit